MAPEDLHTQICGMRDEMTNIGVDVAAMKRALLGDETYKQNGLIQNIEAANVKTDKISAETNAKMDKISGRVSRLEKVVWIGSGIISCLAVIYAFLKDFLIITKVK